MVKLHLAVCCLKTHFTGLAVTNPIYRSIDDGRESRTRQPDQTGRGGRPAGTAVRDGREVAVGTAIADRPPLEIRTSATNAYGSYLG